MFNLFRIIFLLSACGTAMGSNIIGSYLEWQAIPNKVNEYKIRLTLYLDETSGFLSNPYHQNVYLIQNDRHWEQGSGQWQYFGRFELERTFLGKIEHDTAICSDDAKRGVFLNVYETVTTIPTLPQYVTNNGFVLAWCNPLGQRDGGDANFVNSSLSHEWVTTFVPAPVIDAANVRNSSPQIGSLSTFYICKDAQVAIPLSVIDSDGDELKYRLSKPYAVRYNKYLSGEADIFSADLNWASGYDEQNQMTGNPGLSIDANTGVVSVNPDKPGRYFIGIAVDEYRNGKKLGAINFYYTITVVDCGEALNFDRQIYHDSTSVTDLTICQGQEITLVSKQTFVGGSPEFQWTKNGKTIWGENAQSIVISEEGEYQLKISKIAGCIKSFESEIVHISILSSGAEMDSIPPICDTAAPIALHATPPGGTFVGTGVAGSTFDPQLAGEGIHEIRYVVEGSEACPTAIAKREVVVSWAPMLDLVDVLYTSRDKPISIGVKDSLNVAYRWTPSDYLNDVTYANPTSKPSAGVTYMVTATNAFGCTASREVKIKIAEKILIPDAFTPNNDGINDTWELKGISNYAKCRVTIYNRWGEVIFHSVGYQNPFDGTVAGALQMPGVYAYKIRLSEHSPELTGSLTLLR